METALIIACVVLPLIAYALGRWQQNKDDSNLFELYKAEIARLTTENAALLGSLYHRIGYQPKPVVNGIAASAPTPEQTEEAPERKAVSIPDIYKRREQAFEKDRQSEKQKAARAQGSAR